jgi:hypothetical protein
VESLRDGHDRPCGDATHAWQGPVGEALTFSWARPETIGGLRLIFDSDLGRPKRMPCSYPRQANGVSVPEQMIRNYRVEAQDGDGRWQVVARETDNSQRLVRLPLGLTAKAIRLVPETTWGAKEARIFSVDVLREKPQRVGAVPDGEPWPAVVARTPAEDLRPPAKPAEPRGRHSA